MHVIESAKTDMIPHLEFDAGVPGEPPVHATSYVEAIRVATAKKQGVAACYKGNNASGAVEMI
jgi:hypothetical protein